MKFKYLKWTLPALLITAVAFAVNYTRFDGLIIKTSASIGSNTTPNSKAVLDLTSTTKGFLPPRMDTTARDAIASPTTGLQIFNTSTGYMNYYNGSSWLQWSSLAGTETLTNKTLTSPAINGANFNFGTATNSNRLLLPTDTTTNLDALTDTAGLLAYDSTLNVPVFNNGSSWQQVGSGSGGGGSGINILSEYNPNAEVGSTLSWSESGGGTLTVTSTSANVANGTYAFSFDASAASDYAASTSVAIPSGLYGANCLLETYAKGFDANITFQVHDGTNVIASQALSAALTGYNKIQINFVCPSSGSLEMRILASADAAIGYWDEVHLGSATNVTSGAIEQDLGTEVWADNQANATTSVKLTRKGQWIEALGTTTFTGADSGTISITIPAAYYGDTNVYSTSVLEDIGDWTAIDNGSATAVKGSVYFSIGALTELSLSATLASGTYTALAGTSATVPHTWASPDIAKWYARWRVANWQATTVVRANIQPWRVDANISGANITLSTSAQTDYATSTIENGSLTLTNNSCDGCLTAQIPCSSTNASSGTTCSAGDESVGVAFTIPRAGAALACASFSGGILTGAGGSVQGAYQIVETPNNAQTISQEGKSRVDFANGVASTTVDYPISRLCGTFNFSSAGLKTLRLRYEQAVGGTVTSHTLYADAAATVGQRDIHWEVYPIDQQMPVPILVGSVTSNSTGAERIERANLTCGSSAAINSQSGSWISSIGNVSAGACAITFVSGRFSGTPVCVVTATGTTDPVAAHSVNSSSSTGITVDADNASTGADATSYTFNLICVGPR